MENAFEHLRVLAIGCHPDDIEFMMSGTLFLLKSYGLSINYMNVADGCCGTQEYDTEKAIAIRAKEAKDAASFLGAHWYPSIAHDLEVVYDLDLVKKVSAVVREVCPDIMLVPSLYDYMEDHMNTARIASTAAFTIGMPNFKTKPERDITHQQIALYHALPYGLCDAYQRKIIPQFAVNTTSVVEKKAHMLSCHVSQRNWLDESQKLDSYVETMYRMDKKTGALSGKFPYAEGWIRHSPLGYSDPSFKPLETILADCIVPVDSSQ